MDNGTKAETLLQAMIDAVWVAHKLRAVGARAGAVNAAGGGTWGILHTLMREGPMTVPQIARMRPVARQHIQVLANELSEEGLIAFESNPAHKRSRLLVVTPEGVLHYEAVKQRLLGLADEIGLHISGDDVAATSRVLEQVMGELDKQIDPNTN